MIMGKVFEQYKHLGTTEYICASCSSTFSVVTCFDKRKSKLGVRFCNKRCWYDYKSKNKITWNKGLKGVMKPNSGSFKKGDHGSPKTQFKKGQMSGANSPTWKGGITPINTMIRQSTEYKAWRRNVFMRDDYTCQMCFKRGVTIHADHIKPFAYYPELRMDLSNGRTLCVDCHKKTPSYLKRQAA